MAATSPSTTPGGGRPLRRDAERNRRVILDAARVVVAELGLDAGFDEIARRAGVGVGTVYRRFPDREDLIEALFTERISEVVALAEVAAARDDTWEALAWFMERSIELQASDRGLQQVLAGSSRGHERMAGARERLVPAVGVVLARAQATGGVRRDLQVLDLAALGAMVSSVGAPVDPELWRRYLALLLDGLQETRTSSTPLPGTVPEEVEIDVAAGPSGPRRIVRR